MSGQHPKAFKVGTVHFGPRLLAFAAFQKMICGVSYDKIRLGFEQMLGFPVARSTLSRAMQRRARRAKPTRDALVEALRASPVVYADETGWKQGGRRVWLWVFTNLRETVYEILPGRGFEQAASGWGKTTRAPSGYPAGPPTVASRKRRYRPATTICCIATSSATRGAVRFPRLVKCHPPARPRLARSARCWRDQPAWPARCQGTPPGEDEPPAARPIHQSCQPAIRETSATLSGQPLCVPRPCGRRGHQLSRRTRHSIAVVNRKTCSEAATVRERGTGPVDPHERPPELPSQRDPRDRHRHVNPSLPTTPPSPWSTQSGKQLR